jgi:hypothetical protein
MYQIYHTYISNISFTPSLFPFPSSLDSWNSYSRYPYFNYMHVYTCLLCNHPLPPFPATSLLLLVGPVLHSCSLILQRRKKTKRKTWHFCLFEIKVLFRKYIHISMYICVLYICDISPLIIYIWPESLSYCGFTIRFEYSFLYREYITHNQLLSFLLLPYPSCAWPPRSVTIVS